MKKLCCILLSLIILVTTNMTVAFAADNSDVQSKTIRYTLASSEEKSGSMPVRIEQDHVYVDAEFIGALLGFTTAKNDKAILFENLERTKRVVFYLNSTKVIALTYLNANLQYTSPCKTISENSQIWVPLEFALNILDSSLTIVDDEILITPSQETIWSATYEAHLKNEQYNFDWQDDFGYSEVVQKILGSTGYLTTLLNGILHLDVESAFQFVTQFFGDSTVYDNKYGEDLAKLFVINSDEEFEAMNEDIDRLTDVLSPNGKFRGLFDSIEDWEVSNASELANKYLDLIKTGNASNLELNAAYKQFEQALDSEKSFLDSTAPFKKFQDTLAKDSHQALDIIDQIFDVIQYSSEYQNKDKFALDALKNYYDQGMKEDYIPEQIVKTFASVIKDLESSIGEYTLKNFLTNDLMEELVDGTVNETIKNKIGAKASTALVVWNIVSEYVPCLKESLDGADKFILATYSQIFQSDSYRLLNLDSTISKNELYQVAQAYYTYLKFCYVTRQSALSTIEAQKYVDSESYEKVKQYQLDINKEIADLLAVFKSAQINANGTINNDNRIYGYLPDDNEKYLNSDSDEKLIALISETSELSFHYEQQTTNLLNGGMAVYDVQNKKHYYVLDESFLYCHDEKTGKDYQVLKANKNLYNLNIHNDTLYYCGQDGEDSYNERTTLYKYNLNDFSTQSFNIDFIIENLIINQDLIYFTAYDADNNCCLYSVDLFLNNKPQLVLTIQGGMFNFYENSILYLSELNTNKSTFNISSYNLDTAQSEVLFSDVACGNISEPIYEQSSVIFEIINGVLFVSPEGQRGKTIINRFDLNTQVKLPTIVLNDNQTQANIFDGNIVCWDAGSGIGLLNWNSLKYSSLYQYSDSYLSKAFVIGNYIYYYGVDSCVRISKDGSFATELLDQEEIFKQALETQLEYEASEREILQFIYGDFNSDGLHESFAVVGQVDSWMNDFTETESGWYKDCQIYGITVNSLIYGVFPLMDSMNGNILNPIVVDTDEHTFFAFEQNGGGSGSLTHIFYFNNYGELQESAISGTYMNFHVENGKFIAYSHDFAPEGGHSYISHEFLFDENIKDFVKLN